MYGPDYNACYYVISAILGTDLYAMQNAKFKMTVVCRSESTNNNS